MISGTYPIRAMKARYFEDGRIAERVLPPPKPGAIEMGADQKPDDWTKLPLPPKAADSAATTEPAVCTGDGKPTPTDKDDPANAGIRREPELPEYENIEPSKPALVSEFAFDDTGEEPDNLTVRLAELRSTLPTTLACKTTNADQAYIPPAAEPLFPARRLRWSKAHLAGSGRRGRLGVIFIAGRLRAHGSRNQPQARPPRPTTRKAGATHQNLERSHRAIRPILVDDNSGAARNSPSRRAGKRHGKVSRLCRGSWPTI
jgi:hypothetical protein